MALSNSLSINVNVLNDQNTVGLTSEDQFPQSAAFDVLVLGLYSLH
jgi:hypothetical protein